MNNEDDYLMMSGIQHFDFCRRQWALIHIEQQWEENALTAEGRVDHERCHNDGFIEKRKDVVIIRGMRVLSHKLKMSGVCDVVEFHKCDNGITLEKYPGNWHPIPVEYKHGETKNIDADRLQLCAQAIALEEMLVCKIDYGYLFYKKTNRRELIDFTEELRNKTISISEEMNNYFYKGWTPSVKKKSKCKSCSLIERCLPSLEKSKDVNAYIDYYMRR